MKEAAARAMMALAASCLGESRREWSAAMQAEFESAVTDEDRLSFAMGCLAAAWRGMPACREGRFVLTNYALAIGLMIPMAAVQIGCALLGFPYLFPGKDGLAGAVLEGGEQEALLRGLYQAAVPPLAMLLLLLGVGHLLIAWAMLDRAWNRVARLGALLLAAATTLLIFMTVFFLDSSQALLQTAALAIELAAIAMIARWHGQLCPAAGVEQPG